MRDFIISEIKRIAADNGGIAPGQDLFTKITGITPAKWRGVHWLRWSDAIVESGFSANTWTKKLDTSEVLNALATFTRQLGRLPTRTEVRMQRRIDPSFPSHSTVGNHFRTNADLSIALVGLSTVDPQWADLTTLLQLPTEPKIRNYTTVEGLVYLLKSGQHYKIGRSDNIERRFREVKIALPETVTLVHTIRTDDPSGIEAYWHRRFSDKRANGEWFTLNSSDVKAFCRRTFQ